MGFEHKSSDRWQKNCSDEEIEYLKHYCRKKQLEITVFEKNFSRASNYREKFFSFNHGIFNHEKYYRCVYCGHIKKKKNITVDHLIPVQKVLKGRLKGAHRTFLRLQRINDVNDVKNLVAACKHCNSRKGTKTGLWFIRGYLGKHTSYWVIVRLIELVIVITLIYFFITVKGSSLFIFKK